MPTLRLILVPLDGSSPSLAALEHAVVLAEDYDARVELLHVVPRTDRLDPDARAEIQNTLDAAFRWARATLGSRVSRRIVAGDPLREILEGARDADLIVMGTHGRIGRLHELLGSIAEGVVRNASCPVLTVRDPTAGYQSFAERRHHRPSLAEQAAGSHTRGF